MSAQVALVLNTKSYAPRGKNSGDVATWALVSDATFGGAASQVTEKVGSKPTSQGNTVVSFKLIIPKAATASSTCACEGQEISKWEMDINIRVPSNFTAAERDDARLRAQALVANAIFTSAVRDLEAAW